MINREITVACVLRTPNKSPTHKAKVYSLLDVIKLKKMFNKHLSIPYKFVCLSDQDLDEIETIKLIGNTPSWWAKIELFRPNIFETPVFYIDLDMVICNNLDPIIKACKGHNFVNLGDSKKGVFGSGIIYFEGDHSDLWKKYVNDPLLYQKKYNKKPRYGDQAFIEDNKQFEVLTEIANINPNWFHRLKFNSIPHVDSKVLVAAGKGNKLHRKEYKSHPWIINHYLNL